MDFRVHVHGSLHTIVSRGVSHNAYFGKPTCREAEDFAVKYAFGWSASFSTFLYGVEGSLAMANTWVSKCQYFYNIWKSSGDDGYIFTDADWDGWQPGDNFNALYHALTKLRARERQNDLRTKRYLM